MRASSCGCVPFKSTTAGSDGQRNESLQRIRQSAELLVNRRPHVTDLQPRIGDCRVEARHNRPAIVHQRATIEFSLNGSSENTKRDRAATYQLSQKKLGSIMLWLGMKHCGERRRS